MTHMYPQIGDFSKDRKVMVEARTKPTDIQITPQNKSILTYISYFREGVT